MKLLRRSDGPGGGAPTSAGSRVPYEVKATALLLGVLEHLFEPFFSTRDSSGLGLSVVHGIVAEHGGTVRGENRRQDATGNGGGARVAVELPAAADPEPGPNRAKQSTS